MGGRDLVWFDISKRVNTLRPRQNGRRFADDTFKRIFLNENVRILIKISLKFVPKGPINNIPALVQIMAWCRSGDKPLSEPMMVSLLAHICVTRPQWVNMRPWLEGELHFYIMDIMVHILPTAFSNAFSLTKNYCISNTISLNCFTKGPIYDKKSTRVGGSYYLSQCWLRSTKSYGVTRPNELKRLSDWLSIVLQYLWPVVLEC